MRKRLWFVAKRYGWGWTPVTWEGWLVTFVYVGGMVGYFSYYSAAIVSLTDTLMRFVLPFGIGTAFFVAVCYFKGERPRWRWGT